jgi:hypothetical protein
MRARLSGGRASMAHGRAMLCRLLVGKESKEGNTGRDTPRLQWKARPALSPHRLRTPYHAHTVSDCESDAYQPCPTTLHMISLDIILTPGKHSSLSPSPAPGRQPLRAWREGRRAQRPGTLLPPLPWAGLRAVLLCQQRICVCAAAARV